MPERPPQILVVILDGLGDRPWPVLGGRTPVSAAATPNLDAVAAAGTTGILHSAGRGRAPGTELAHFVLFGYEERSFPGRAVFEAAGAGIELRPGQVALHAILATVARQADSTLRITQRYPHGDDALTRELFASVAHFELDGVTVTLHHTKGEQAIITLDGDVSADVTDTDPHNNQWLAGTVQPLRDASDPAAAERTARVLTAYLRHSYRRFAETASGAAADESPFLLLKWVGRRMPLADFATHTGMRGCVISSAGVLQGLSAELGLEHRWQPTLPDLAEDMRSRLRAGRDVLAEGIDFALVHTKAPDEAGHAKDPALKRDAIAAIDAGLAGLANREGLPPGTIVVVTGDHGTPAGTTLIHSGDPVPLAVLTDAAAPDSVTSFDEMSCSAGALGHVNGAGFMPMLLGWRGTVRYTGGRLAAHTGLHWPDDYDPFVVE